MDRAKEMRSNKMLVMACIAVLVASMILGSRVQAAGDYLSRQFDALRRKPLVGLTGVHVMIEIEALGPDVRRDGLDRSTLEMDVELKLRQAGIRIFTDAERLASAGEPYLYLNITAVAPENRSGEYALCLQLKLIEEVRLTRTGTLKLAPTWEDGQVVTVRAGYLSRVREFVKDMVDKFSNDYLAANPKR